MRVARRETTEPGGPGAPDAPGAPGAPGRPTPPDAATLGYEQARDELASIVARLESGAGTLEESLALWERGEALAARCQEWLDGARARLTAARGGSAPVTDGGSDETDEEEL